MSLYSQPRKTVQKIITKYVHIDVYYIVVLLGNTRVGLRN